MKGDDKMVFRKSKVIVAICITVLCQTNAQTNNSSPTNQIEQAKAESITIKVGDTFEYVLKVLGEPRVDCPLKDGKHVLFYEVGEVHFQDNKVTSYSMLTPEQVVEKRDTDQQRRHQVEQKRQTAKETRVDNLENYNKSVKSREDQLKQTASTLLQQRDDAQANMRQYMVASTDSAKRFIMLYGGTRREERILKSLAGITDPNEFYNATADISADISLGNLFRARDQARLAFISWSEDRFLFLKANDTFLESSKALEPIRAELEQIETKRDRIRRHGY